MASPAALAISDTGGTGRTELAQIAGWRAANGNGASAQTTSRSRYARRCWKPSSSTVGPAHSHFGPQRRGRDPVPAAATAAAAVWCPSSSLSVAPGAAAVACPSRYSGAADPRAQASAHERRSVSSRRCRRRFRVAQIRRPAPAAGGWLNRRRTASYSAATAPARAPAAATKRAAVAARLAHRFAARAAISAAFVAATVSTPSMPLANAMRFTMLTSVGFGPHSTKWRRRRTSSAATAPSRRTGGAARHAAATGRHRLRVGRIYQTGRRGRAHRRGVEHTAAKAVAALLQQRAVERRSVELHRLLRRRQGTTIWSIAATAPETTICSGSLTLAIAAASVDPGDNAFVEPICASPPCHHRRRPAPPTAYGDLVRARGAPSTNGSVPAATCAAYSWRV